MGCERQQHNKVYASPRSRGRRVTSCCLCGQASRPTTLNISIMLSCKSGLQVVDPQIGLKIFCSDFQLPNGMIDCQQVETVFDICPYPLLKTYFSQGTNYKKDSKQVHTKSRFVSINHQHQRSLDAVLMSRAPDLQPALSKMGSIGRKLTS